MGTTAITLQFKQDTLNGGHNFKVSGGIAYKALLIKATPTGTYNNTLTNVGTPGSGSPSVSNVGTDEASGTGYTTGGVALTNSAVILSGSTACATFATNPSWASATFSASGLVVYTNDSTLGTAGRVVGYYDFGGAQTVTGATFTVTLPTDAAGTALIQVA